MKFYICIYFITVVKFGYVPEIASSPLQDISPEAYCEIPCGPNEDCVANEKCVCQEGYLSTISENTGLPYCKPQCNIRPCSEHAKCVEPEGCECDIGYNYVDLDCMPQCSSNCPYGFCVAPEVCNCSSGYKSVGSTCVLEQTNTTSKPTTTPPTTAVQLAETSGNYFEKFPETIFWEDAIEPITETSFTSTSEPYSDITTDSIFNFDVNESTSAGIDDDTTELASKETSVKFGEKCLQGYVYYEGGCRPQIGTTEVICDPDTCGANMQCMEGGICACLPGFSWHYADSGPILICVAAKAPVKDQPHTPKSAWLGSFVTALGMACVVAAFMFLTGVLYTKHTPRNAHVC